MLERGGEGRRTGALLDTGASRSFTSESALKQQGGEVKILGQKQAGARVRGFCRWGNPDEQEGGAVYVKIGEGSEAGRGVSGRKHV